MNKTFKRIFATALLLTFGAALSRTANEQTLEQELPGGDVKSIVLKGGNGSVRVSVAEADSVTVRVVVRPEKKSDRQPLKGIKKWFLSSAYDDPAKMMDAIELDTNISGAGNMVIGLNPGTRARESRVREEWTITVPQHVALKLAMSDATVNVTGVSGGVNLSLGHGSVDVDVPGGDLDIDVTVGKARVKTGSESIGELSVQSQVGDTDLSMNGMKMKYSDPPGPGSHVTLSGDGDDDIKVYVQVGDASVQVNEK